MTECKSIFHAVTSDLAPYALGKVIELISEQVTFRQDVRDPLASRNFRKIVRRLSAAE